MFSQASVNLFIGAEGYLWSHVFPRGYGIGGEGRVGYQWGRVSGGRASSGQGIQGWVSWGGYLGEG